MPPFFSISWPKEEKRDESDEPPNPEGIKFILARLALKLGGFDKVRKLTILQARLMSKAIADEQTFLAKINGCEIKETAKEATVNDLNMLMGMFG